MSYARESGSAKAAGKGWGGRRHSLAPHLCYLQEIIVTKRINKLINSFKRNK
jgi:hypothetical protein